MGRQVSDPDQGTDDPDNEQRTYQGECEDSVRILNNL